MSYGIDLSGHVGYTGSFDVPAGLNRTIDKPRKVRLGGDSYESRVALLRATNARKKRR